MIKQTLCGLGAALATLAVLVFPALPAADDTDVAPAASAALVTVAETPPGAGVLGGEGIPDDDSEGPAEPSEEGAPQSVPDEMAPQAAADLVVPAAAEGEMALLNLLGLIVTAVLGVAMMLSYTGAAAGGRNEEQAPPQSSLVNMLGLAIFGAVAVLFFATQNLAGSIVVANALTPIFAIATGLQVLCAVVGASARRGARQK